MMKLKCKNFMYIGLIFLFVAVACSARIDESIVFSDDIDDSGPISTGAFSYGADLSYVNEMEDCGAVYKDASNNVKDVYEIFDEVGANLARFRLWNDPTWTNYSNLEDVKQSIQRAKSKNMRVLLDFHYSDTWAILRINKPNSTSDTIQPFIDLILPMR